MSSLGAVGGVVHATGGTHSAEGGLCAGFVCVVMGSASSADGVVHATGGTHSAGRVGCKGCVCAVVGSALTFSTAAWCTQQAAHTSQNEEAARTA